jgi:hypothetical protein
MNIYRQLLLITLLFSYSNLVSQESATLNFYFPINPKKSTNAIYLNGKFVFKMPIGSRISYKIYSFGELLITVRDSSNVLKWNELKITIEGNSDYFIKLNGTSIKNTTNSDGIVEFQRDQDFTGDIITKDEAFLNKTVENIIVDYVEQKVKEWSVRGKYEKEDAFNARMQSENVKAQTNIFAKEILLKLFSDSFDIKNAKLKYNVDNETFHIQIKNYDSIYVKVPSSEAEIFENNFASIQLENCEVNYQNSKFSVRHIDFRLIPNNKIYSYDDKNVNSLDYEKMLADYKLSQEKRNVTENKEQANNNQSSITNQQPTDQTYQFNKEYVRPENTGEQSVDEFINKVFNLYDSTYIIAEKIMNIDKKLVDYITIDKITDGTTYHKINEQLMYIQTDLEVMKKQGNELIAISIGMPDKLKKINAFKVVPATKNVALAGKAAKGSIQLIINLLKNMPALLKRIAQIQQNPKEVANTKLTPVFGNLVQTKLNDIQNEVQNIIQNTIVPADNNSIAFKTEQEIFNMNPRNGQMVFNTTSRLLLFFDGNTWQQINYSCWPQPSKAETGKELTVEGQATVLLYAKKPEFGVGEWTILSGNEGIISDKSNPSSLFTGKSSITYILQWTVSTKCNSNSSEIKVVFK